MPANITKTSRSDSLPVVFTATGHFEICAGAETLDTFIHPAECENQAAVPTGPNGASEGERQSSSGEGTCASVSKCAINGWPYLNQSERRAVEHVGNLLYSLARSAKAKTVVEFGTSFGISTIFLASAIRDNGDGKVITTEFDPEKAERAKRNLAAAGLEEWVEFRVGNALETLKSNPPREIDLILLDGAKGLYLDVLKLLEPYLRSGGIIASDNTDHDGIDAFLEYLRAASNGYTSSGIMTTEGEMNRGHEIAIRN